MLLSMWTDGISDREYYGQFGSCDEPEDDGCPQCGASSGQACEEECGRDIHTANYEWLDDEDDDDDDEDQGEVGDAEDSADHLLQACK
jgi:hypothetical protein